MKKLKLLLRTIILPLFGVFISQCSTQKETKNPISKEGFHYSDVNLSKIEPLGFSATDNSYHIFYSNETSWAEATSTDLMNWSFTRAIPIESNLQGTIILDEENKSKLGSTSQAPWIIFYASDSEILLKYSLDKSNWEDHEISMPAGIQGTPKITSWSTMGSYLMTVSDEDSAYVLVSSDLIQWEKLTTINIPPASIANLTFDKDKCILIINDKNPLYQVGQLSDSTYKELTTFKPLNIYGEELDFTFGYNIEKSIIIHTIKDRIFGIAKQINLTENTLMVSPVQELNNIAATKRRGKLSKLKGQTSSRFTFPVESLENQFSLQIFNDQGEQLIIEYNKQKGFFIDKTKASNTIDGESYDIPYILANHKVSIDLIIDYSAVELVINNGELVIPIEINALFIYDQIMLTIDEKYSDARAIIYTLDKALI